MVYIITDDNGFVLNVKKPSINPVESKRAAAMAMANDTNLVSKTNEIAKLEAVKQKHKSGIMFDNKIDGIRLECKDVVRKHILENKKYFKPVAKVGNINESDIPIDDIALMVKNKTKTQKIKLDGDTLVYVDDFTGIEFYKKTGNKWSKHSVSTIGELPKKTWIKKSDLTKEQLVEIEVQNETPEEAQAKARELAYSAFIDRIWKESDEYNQLGE